MKVKITRSTLRLYNNRVVVGYCNIYNLLQLFDANYYNAGVYGWNYDAYTVDADTIIITGYRPTAGTHKASYELCEKYNAYAGDLLKEINGRNYEEIKNRMRGLLNDFIGDVLSAKN